MPERAASRQLGPAAAPDRPEASPHAGGRMTPVICRSATPDDAPDMTTRAGARHFTGTFAHLRAEHGRAMELLAAFERSLAETPRPERDERPLLTLARYLAGPFAAQLAVEEGVLYPALVQHLPELAQVLEPLLEDHAEIRDMARSLQLFLAQPSQAKRDEQLLVLGRDLIDLLRLHISREERSALDWSERVLATPVRDDLARRIARILSSGSRRNRLQP